jgi:integrase
MATFSQQADIYLAAIAARKPRPVKATTIKSFRWLIGLANPLIGSLNLEDIRDGTLKRLVDSLCDWRYSPSTIQSLVNVVNLVVASDVDADGSPKHPRKWTLDSIDAPLREPKREIPLRVAQIENALAVLKSPMREFFVTQLATGCQKAELRALKIDDFDATAGLLRVSRTLPRYEETTVATKARRREVDVAPEITAMLVAMLDGRKQGRLFDVSIDHIQWVYEKLAITSHQVRYFRYRHLLWFKIPRSIHNLWTGRSFKGIDGQLHDRELRQRLAREVGIGFHFIGTSVSVPEHGGGQIYCEILGQAFPAF